MEATMFYENTGEFLLGMEWFLLAYWLNAPTYIFVSILQLAYPSVQICFLFRKYESLRS